MLAVYRIRTTKCVTSPPLLACALDGHTLLLKLGNQQSAPLRTFLFKNLPVTHVTVKLTLTLTITVKLTLEVLKSKVHKQSLDWTNLPEFFAIHFDHYNTVSDSNNTNNSRIKLRHMFYNIFEKRFVKVTLSFSCM